MLQNIVTPLRFFGLNPSRRASFSTSGEGSEEASDAELAGLEAVAAESVPAGGVAGAAAGLADAVAEEGVADEREVGDAVAPSAGAGDAGDWAPHGVPVTRISKAKRAGR